MKTNIKKSLAITALALSGSLFAAQSFGAVLNLSGSSSIGSSGATIGLGLDLNAPGLITVVNPIFGINTGDYAPLLLNAPFTFSATALDLSNMSTFNINGPASSGTYVVSQLIIKAQDANFLDVYTRGLFTPGSLLGTQSGGCATGGNTCAVSDTSLRWSFTKNGFSPWH